MDWRAKIKKCAFVSWMRGGEKEGPRGPLIATCSLHGSPVFKNHPAACQLRADHCCSPCPGSCRHCVLPSCLGKDRCPLIVQMCNLFNCTYFHVWKCLNMWVIFFFFTLFLATALPGSLSTATSYLLWSSQNWESCPYRLSPLYQSNLVRS